MNVPVYLKCFYTQNGTDSRCNNEVDVWKICNNEVDAFSEKIEVTDKFFVLW